jgi:hypothetical protein
MRIASTLQHVTRDGQGYKCISSLDAPLYDARSSNENEMPQHGHGLEKARGSHMMMAKKERKGVKSFQIYPISATSSNSNKHLSA